MSGPDAGRPGGRRARARSACRPHCSTGAPALTALHCATTIVIARDLGPGRHRRARARPAAGSAASRWPAGLRPRTPRSWRARSACRWSSVLGDEILWRRRRRDGRPRRRRRLGARSIRARRASMRRCGRRTRAAGGGERSLRPRTLPAVTRDGRRIRLLCNASTRGRGRCRPRGRRRGRRAAPHGARVPRGGRLADRGRARRAALARRWRPSRAGSRPCEPSTSEPTRRRPS